MNDDLDPKCVALAKCLGVDVATISEARYGCDSYECESEPGEYLVLTDEEADAAWDASLESYIDDVILDEFPEGYHNYFDREAWKRDAKHDGRGHSLSSYDGDEHEEKIDGVWYYIYRTN